MKANFLLPVALCVLLIAGIGIAQYGQPSEGSGYGQGGYSAPPQSGQGFGPQQGQQEYGQPSQSMQPQGEGFEQGFAPTSFASSVGGFESYRLPFERGIRTGDPTSFASHLLFVSFRIALAKNKGRLNLDEKCLTETGEKEVADLLVSYYNESGGKELAERIVDNREVMLTDLCREDACSKGFSSDDFVRNAPPEVRKAIQKDPSLKFDATTPAVELKQKIKEICETVVESEFSNRQSQMEKQITQMTNRFTQECARAEQQKQQMEQQQQQWQQREGVTCGIGSEPYLDESGKKQCRQSVGRQYGGQPQGPPPQCPNGWHIEGRQRDGQYVQEYVCNEGGGGQGPQCPPDQYWNGTNCVQGGGQNPPAPQCGNGQCEAGEDQTNCPADCGQQGGGGGAVCGNGACEAGEDSSNCSADCGQPAPVCGNGACEAGEDNSNCPADCTGGLASNVLNKMFGGSLYSFTALVNLLRLQEGGYGPPPGGGYGSPGGNYGPPLGDGYGEGTGYGPPGGNYEPSGNMPQGYNCPPGEYPDPSRIGNCIRSDSGLGSSGGYDGSQGMSPPQGGGYGGQQGPGMGPSGGFGGPGFGSYPFEEMCENPEQKIREQFSGEMDGMKEEMSERCDDEAARRTQEILRHSEEILLNRAECEADTAEMCSEATAVVAALEKALNNIQEPANQIANFECAKRTLAKAQATQNEMDQAALELATLTENGERQLGQEGVAAGSATAMGIISQSQAVQKSKLDAGFVRWFIESPEVKKTLETAAKALEKNLETVEDMENQGNLTQEQQEKLKEIKEKMLVAKTKATNCQGATIVPSLFGC